MPETTTAAHDTALDRIDDLRGGLLEVAALIAANPNLPIIRKEHVEDDKTLVLQAQMTRPTPERFREVVDTLGPDAAVTIQTYSSGHRYLRVRRTFGPVAYEAWTVLGGGTDHSTITPVAVDDLGALLPADTEVPA